MNQFLSSCSSCDLTLDQVCPLPLLRRFSYEEIKRATGGFGRGVAKHSHGVVYKAHFRDGLVAVVKEAKLYHEKDVFYGVVQLLGSLHHRHLVTLLGFSTGPERFLVFEYAENGSLKEHLNDPLKTPLTWRTRLQILTSVASALEYLHFFCEPPVCHVSINSSNILLDENFVAKLSDVGLPGSPANSIVTTYLLRTKDSQDVIFQLGVLILELITGQSSAEEGMDLVQWVQGRSCTSSVHQMLDPDLGNSYDSEKLRSLLRVARLCTRTGKKPFSVKQILLYLQGKVEPSVPHV